MVIDLDQKKGVALKYIKLIKDILSCFKLYVYVNDQH